MLLDEINKRIIYEYDSTIIEKLSIINLREKYIKSKSVIDNKCILKNILKTYLIDDVIISNILDDYTPFLIPPGLKGVIKGNLFNNIIFDKIKSFNLSEDRFEIIREMKHGLYKTDEIPDWYIYDKYNNKILIGMNQLDFWSGGHQVNRGFKYIHYKRTDSMKLVSIIANFIEVKQNSKIFELFDKGFTNNTLSYIGGLYNIIVDYFDL